MGARELVNVKLEASDQQQNIDAERAPYPTMVSYLGPDIRVCKLYLPDILFPPELDQFFVYMARSAGVLA